MAEVRFDGVTKTFGDVKAVDNLTMTVENGEFLVLLGPSGCGKTTALRMIAGLEEISAGSLYIGDDEVNDIPPKDRDIAMVFQSYALYPHLTVRRNIEFPLRQKDYDKAERDARVAKAAATLQLTELLDRKPGQLSGGQRQRVALARAIVRQPRVYLMDEPLSNLDAILRTQTRADIVAIQQELATTTVFVTHDQVEAMTMGHRIAVLSGGQLQQVGPPVELYERPANTFVAGFLGNPGMNLVAGEVADGVVSVNGTAIREVRASNGPVTVGARPETLRLAPEGLVATASFTEVLGADVLVLCTLPSGERFIVRQALDRPRPQSGEAIHIAVVDDGKALHLFDIASGGRLEASP
jgi:multiple sugar transport system ATP-binding protein